MVVLNGNEMTLQLKRSVDDSYGIAFGEKLFPEIAAWLRAWRPGSRYAIITDTVVGPLYADALEKALQSQGLAYSTFDFVAGEASKNIYAFADIIDGMDGAKFDRDTVILALGGGVVGDLAGYVADSYLRGVDFIQIPTTFLAQADASVGGKVGIDTRRAKNAVGGFKQPKRVFVDIATLRTQEMPDYMCGFAETAKHGVTADAAFFDWLESNLGAVMSRLSGEMLYVAKQNCRIKGTVVENDPNERGQRRILNFGHTPGHAIETLSDYTIRHGQCVSIGMMVSGRVSHYLGLMPASDLERIRALLECTGLPTTIPARFENKAILEAMTRDKKSKGGRTRFCLPERIGKMCEFDGQYATAVELGVVERALDETRD